MSTFGKLFRVTTYGESHCASVGAIIDGCPPVGLDFVAGRSDLKELPRAWSYLRKISKSS